MWKQTETDYNLTVKCYKRNKILSHSIVPDTSFQSLTEFYVNSSAAVLPATEDTFSFVWQYTFVLCFSKHPT